MELKTEGLIYEYEAKTPMAKRAVDGITLSVPSGQFVGIVGHTGSGKTTFVQLLDGLLTPTDGRVLLDGRDIFSKDYDRKGMRGEVGIVFQYPEYQLFESTVIKDVCFGPKNRGLDEEEAKEKAKEALRKVSVKEEAWENSPFELSGGQKRRVAIAGVIAMEPKILILDEPTAGLDPGGRDEILELLSALHESGMTILLVSHSMEDVANYVERIIVLDRGRIFLDGKPKEVFSHREELESIGLAAPEVSYIMQAVADAGFDVDTNITTVEEAVEEIKRKLC